MTDLALLFYLAPLSLVAATMAARLEPGARPRRVLWASRAATFTALAFSAAAAALVVAGGPLESPLLGADGLGLSIRLDGVSVVMFVLVAFVGLLVVQFSRQYLDGDTRQGVFLGRLCLTIAAVLCLVTAGNLVQLVASWIAMSLALHGLLVFYDRPGARIAARKKFIAARLGDVALLGAAILTVRAFGTGDLGAIFESARAAAASGVVPAGVGAAAVLVALAAALKSAMFPTQGWLLEVMETPTPVSALLHAGLLNAGTFLVVRLSDLIVLSAPAQLALIAIGGFTALFGSVVMITQSSVKVSLAYSSAAHMGFMLMLCGLGAYTVAILHLVAHSFYKAHAFLSSGSIVDYVRALGARQSPTAPRALHVVASLLGALGVFLGIGWLIGARMGDRPASMALGAIFVMAIAHLLASALRGKPSAYVIGRTVLAAGAVALAFFGLEAGATWMLADSVATLPPPDTTALVAVAIVVASFIAVSVLQTLLPTMAHRPAWRAAWVHLKNGLYANTIFDRLVGAHR